MDLRQSRRAFMLRSTAALGACGLSGIPVACSPAPAKTRVRLPVPLLLAPTGGRMSLRAQQGTTSFVAGVGSSTRGFNGSFLGPTLLLRSGATTDVAVTNGLDESTTVHWHGLLIPSEADGGPHHLIQPNGTWRTGLKVDQPPATLWYHAHPHPRTATQVYSGLAGMIIVSDGRDADVGLPHRYGVDDIPLILRDAVLDQGRLVYPQHPMARMHGVRGATMLANGAVDPVTPVPRAWVRLRLANASNARVFDLAFNDGREFLWIGTDGGLLGTPQARRSLVLAPGQRAELLVDFTAGAGVALVTSRDPTVGGGMGMGMGMMTMADPLESPVSIVRFEPAGPRAAAEPPTRLPGQAVPDARSITRRRELRLTMGMGRGMGGGMGRGMRGGGGAGPMGMGGFGIDGQPFDMERVDHQVRLGDTEIWRVSGDMMQHPFHMHGVHFHVLARNGRGPDPMDAGPKDTVLVQEPVDLLVKFTKPADRIPFMFHCHTLEHEDGGMMGQFSTVG